MARLNSGGFAAGFESGFGLVQKAKKDKRDFELQQENLRQKELDRKADTAYREKTLQQSEDRIKVDRDRLAESTRQFDEQEKDRELQRQSKQVLIDNANRDKEATQANTLQGIIQRAFEGTAPTKDELQMLSGTKYDPMKFVSPEFQDAVRLINNKMGKSADPNNPLTLSQAFSDTEVIEAANIILGSDIQVNLRDNVGKNLIGMQTVPSDLQPKGSKPAVVLDLLITRPDGTVYKDEVTVGRDNNPEAAIQPATVEQLLERLGGSSITAGAFNNLIETGAAKSMYERARDVSGRQSTEKIKQTAFKNYYDMSPSERDDTGLTIDQYVAGAVRVQSDSAKDFQHTAGVTLTGLQQVTEAFIDDYKVFRDENFGTRRDNPELLISGVSEAKQDQLIELYNAVRTAKNENKSDEEIDEIAFNVIAKLFGKPQE